jgi:hypothetical protein
MKATELAVSPEDRWRKIPFTLTTLPLGVLSEIACLHPSFRMTVI